MNFCMECGTVLETSSFGEQPTASYNQQPTVSYPGTPHTNPNTSNEARTVVSNFDKPPTAPTLVSNQTPFSTAPQISTASQMPPPKKGGSKMFLIIGGILALFILGGIGIFAVGLIAYYSQSEVADNPTPTPIPTRTNERTTPTEIPLKNTPTKSETTDPDADYQDMWADFNVKENGKTGMRVHVSFTTKNMKGVNSYLAMYLQKNDGTAVYGTDTAFKSTTGQVAAFKILNPAYDVAKYDDYQIFIPYSAFGLSRGKYKLQLNTYLIYKDAALQAKGPIAQLNVYDFDFEQK